MHPDEAVMLRGLPPVGRPEPVWWRMEYEETEIDRWHRTQREEAEREFAEALNAKDPHLEDYDADCECERRNRAAHVCSLCSPSDATDCWRCLCSPGLPLFRHAMFGIPVRPASSATHVSRWPLFLLDHATVVYNIAETGCWWGSRRLKRGAR